MKTFLTFLLRANKKTIWMTVIGFVCLIFIVWYFQASLDSWYTHYFDPIISILTVVIAIIIWIFQQYNYWKESLPKRLTVHFLYENKSVLSCYEAYLSGTSDVRAWSQQIGAQMTDVQHISFYPYIDSPNPEIRKSQYEKDQKGRFIDIMLCEATFYLKNDNFINSQEIVKRPEIIGKYTVWLDNNKVTPGNVEIIFSQRKDKPLTIEETALIADKLVKAKAAGELENETQKANFFLEFGISDFHL